ncbi:MAG: NUDIX hydrolase [Gammaproteobacteria bacterium]|nr:NUDIX hydrolase [Gammaproteobacteria bacterium]
MTWKPHVTVAAVIEKNSKYLLVEELVDGKAVLNQPAGHLEEHESFVDAVIRETEEETATLFKPEFLVGLYRWIMPQKDRTYLRLCFAGKIIKTLENQPLDTDIIRTRWLSYEEILLQTEQLRSPLVLECIEDYRQGKNFPMALVKDLD